MTPPTPESLRESPETATMLALEAHLDLLPAVLASVYGRDDQSAIADHARGLVRMARVLNLQVATYLDMLAVPEAVSKSAPSASKSAPPARTTGAGATRKRA